MAIFADVAELLRFWRDAEAMRLAAWLEDDPAYDE